jgi:hypothetical protein
MEMSIFTSRSVSKFGCVRHAWLLKYLDVVLQRGRIYTFIFLKAFWCRPSCRGKMCKLLQFSKHCNASFEVNGRKIISICENYNYQIKF